MQQRQEQRWLKAMRRGQKAFQRGKFSEAMTQFGAAVKAAPAKPEGWVNLGVVQIEAGQHKEAFVSLRKAVRMNPKLAQGQLALGDLFRIEGHWQQAIAAYRQALAVERTPEGLNKLACALRVFGELGEAEALYREALLKRPEFGLAKVNLAAVAAELGRLDEADLLLQAAKELNLSAEERAENYSISLALEQFRRVKPAIESALLAMDPSALNDVLASTPEAQLEVDGEVIEGIERFARAAREFSMDPSPKASDLSEDWPLIEALLVIPYVESVTEYCEVRGRLSEIAQAYPDLLESINLEAVVVAARNARGELSDPVRAEMHLRYWHALAVRDLSYMITGTVPGQFKISDNVVLGYEQRRCAKPHRVAGTLRYFFRDIYETVPPGVLRGLVTMKAIFDIHPFVDGNGRLALIILNRELEWAEQMPVLFPRMFGLTGKNRAKASRELPLEPDALPDVIAVVRKGQQFAREFCEELRRS